MLLSPGIFGGAGVRMLVEFLREGLLSENGAADLDREERCITRNAKKTGKLDQTWSVRRRGGYKGGGGWDRVLHTYLEGVIPFMYWGYGL